MRLGMNANVTLGGESEDMVEPIAKVIYRVITVTQYSKRHVALALAHICEMSLTLRK